MRTIRTGAIVSRVSYIELVFVVQSFAQSGTSNPARDKCMSSIAIISAWDLCSTQRPIRRGNAGETFPLAMVSLKRRCSVVHEAPARNPDHESNYAVVSIDSSANY